MQHLNLYYVQHAYCQLYLSVIHRW
ncbi:hypothetical protein BLA29_009189 [Euroglyphus maynei]|uniref:Uncharacterized protein n=1 Tax=Euroglyphus maynei TaxID=6958 RepID=A0A1Y3B023_EURMA|nr:hypothetical protein BLA29_009189 [Euroglyphus maynei]